MEDQNISLMRNHQETFPWLDIFLKQTFQKTALDPELACQLLGHISREMKTSSSRDSERLQVLFEMVKDMLLHFWWKEKWKDKIHWKKCWKKPWDTLDISSEDLEHCCIQNVLSVLIRIGVILSNGDLSSLWVSRTLTAIKVISSREIIYDAILMITKLKKDYSIIFEEILKNVLCVETFGPIIKPITYVKILALFRRLKTFTKDKIALKALQEIVNRIVPPPDTISWMSNHGNTVTLKPKSLGKQLLGKSSNYFFANFVQNVFPKEVKILETKNLAPRNASASISKLNFVTSDERPQKSSDLINTAPKVSSSLKHRRAKRTQRQKKNICQDGNKDRLEESQCSSASSPVYYYSQNYENNLDISQVTTLSSQDMTYINSPSVFSEVSELSTSMIKMEPMCDVEVVHTRPQPKVPDDFAQFEDFKAKVNQKVVSAVKQQQVKKCNSSAVRNLPVCPTVDVVQIEDEEILEFKRKARLNLANFKINLKTPATNLKSSAQNYATLEKSTNRLPADLVNSPLKFMGRNGLLNSDFNKQLLKQSTPKKSRVLPSSDENILPLDHGNISFDTLEDIINGKEEMRKENNEHVPFSDDGYDSLSFESMPKTNPVNKTVQNLVNSSNETTLNAQISSSDNTLNRTVMCNDETGTLVIELTPKDNLGTSLPSLMCKNSPVKISISLGKKQYDCKVYTEGNTDVSLSDQVPSQNGIFRKIILEPGMANADLSSFGANLWTEATSTFANTTPFLFPQCNNVSNSGNNLAFSAETQYQCNENINEISCKRGSNINCDQGRGGNECGPPHLSPAITPCPVNEVQDPSNYFYAMPRNIPTFSSIGSPPNIPLIREIVENDSFAEIVPETPDSRSTNTNNCHSSNLIIIPSSQCLNETELCNSQGKTMQTQVPHPFNANCTYSDISDIETAINYKKTPIPEHANKTVDIYSSYRINKSRIYTDMSDGETSACSLDNLFDEDTDYSIIGATPQHRPSPESKENATSLAVKTVSPIQKSQGGTGSKRIRRVSWLPGTETSGKLVLTYESPVKKSCKEHPLQNTSPHISDSPAKKSCKINLVPNPSPHYSGYNLRKRKRSEDYTTCDCGK